MVRGVGSEIVWLSITTVLFLKQLEYLFWIRVRDYYMTFSISALVLARDSNIKPDSEAGGLIPGNDMENFMS